MGAAWCRAWSFQRHKLIQLLHGTWGRIQLLRGCRSTGGKNSSAPGLVPKRQHREAGPHGALQVQQDKATGPQAELMIPAGGEHRALRLCRASTRGGLLLSLHFCRKVSQEDRAVSWAVQTLPSAARSIFSNRAILSCPCAPLLAKPCSPQLRFTPSPLLLHQWCCRPSPGLQGSMWGHLVYGDSGQPLDPSHPPHEARGGQSPRCPAGVGARGAPSPSRQPAARSLLTKPSTATGVSARSQHCKPAVCGSRPKWQWSSAQLSSHHRSKVPKDISVQPAGG